MAGVSCSIPTGVLLLPSSPYVNERGLLQLGYAEKERQHADQRILDRKTKTGYTAPVTTVHFSVGIAHFTWDHLMDD